MNITRYNIIRLNVIRPGQVIRFQHKIPSYLKRCTGFKAMHVTGIPTDLYVPEIGWFTASFNNMKDEALVVPVSAQSFTEPEVTHEFQELDVELMLAQLVVGVYVDSSRPNNVYPYSVSLYLRSTDEGTKLVAKPKTESVQDKKEDASCDCPNDENNNEDPQDDDDNDEENLTDQLC